MKKIVYLFLLICFSISSNGQCVRDTFNITKISCFDSLGIIVPIYSIPSIQTQGLTFKIDTLYVMVGDSVNFQIGPLHNAVEVSQTTWLANGTTSNGGFSLPLGGGTVIIDSAQTYYYVCQPHASDTMKAIIIATNNPFFYIWYNNSNVPYPPKDSLISDTCGSFHVEVFDHNGDFCDSATRFLGCPLGIVQGQTNIECFGDSSGELRRRPYSGTPPYTYVWEKNGLPFTGGPSDTIKSNLSSGIYKFVVTDDIGCKDSVITNFNNPQQLLFHSISFDSIKCNGNSTVLEIMVQGGRKININGKQYSYYLIQNNDTIALSDSDTTSSGFTSTSPATSYLDTVYFSNIFASTDSLIISVRDSFGCPLPISIFIPQPDPIVAIATTIPPNDTLVCAYDSALISLDTIFGGTSPFNFWWNNDPTLTDSSIYVNGGFNRVYIEDAHGCLDSTNGVQIASHQDFTLTDSLVNIDCFGDTTGKISLQITGGAYPLVYTWEKDGIPFIGGPSDTIKSNLLAGTYRLVIEDANQCMDTSIFDIITAPEIIIYPTLKEDPTCLQLNGSIKVDVIGGNGDYIYNWTGPNMFSSTFDSIGGLLEGMYHITVTDDSSCIMKDSFELVETSSLEIIFFPSTDTLKCYEYSTVIIANISGGVTSNGNYTILWDNGATTQQTILGGGTHQILVIDDVGCKDSATVFIYAPDSLSIDTIIDHPSCLGNDGSASVTVTGGSDNYTYVWSDPNFQTTATATGLVAGNYWVYVTDTCGSATLAIILDPYISTLNIDTFNLTQPSCADNDGAIDITVSGGFTPYTYLWSNGDTTEDISGLGFGTYTVLIADDCGPPIDTTFTLNQQQNTISPSGFYDDLSLWSVVTVNPSFNIDWTMPDGTIIMGEDSIRGLCAGNYPITVTDNLYCEVTFSIDVFYNINQLVDASTSTVIDTSWGMGPFKYLWSDGQTTAHADSLCEGTHTVTVTAWGGLSACPYTDSLDIDLQLILDPALTIVDCEDDFDGRIITNVTNNLHNIPYSFLWSTGDTIDRIEDNLNPGTYSVSVLYNNGCSIDTSIVIKAIGADCIPNVFSPNGNGTNDTWQWNKDQSGDSFLYSESTVTIYGRYGRKMYESVGYNTPWDGKNKKGNPVPDGTYFYVITLKGGVEPIRGTVTILR